MDVHCVASVSVTPGWVETGGEAPTLDLVVLVWKWTLYAQHYSQCFKRASLKQNIDRKPGQCNDRQGC